MGPFTSSGAMPSYDSYSRDGSFGGPRLRSESRNSNLGDRYAHNLSQSRPSNQNQSVYQNWDDQESEDFEHCRPRGSTIGEFDRDHFQNHRRQSSFPGINMYGYGDPYGVSPLSVSPREHMIRTQMMRGSMYGMDPMMGRMGMGIGGGYGSMYGGGMGSSYGMGPPMLAGSAYGYGPRPMMGMGGSIMGTGYTGAGLRPYRMSGLVDTYSPHLMRTKTWSAYGRMM